MRILIHQNYSKMCQWAASYIAKRIKDFAPKEDKPFVLGLPTGSSPLGVYREFIRMHKEGGLSFASVVTFNMDEYVGLSGDHPQSYARLMKENLFSSIDIKPENAHILNGQAADLEEECLSYEENILKHGGIELFLGGMGKNGHIAFNEPGSSLASRTRVKTLNMDTRIANSRFFENDAEKVPGTALTIGVGTIMDAQEVLILVSGHEKAGALKDVVEGAISHWCPLSCLQMHPKAIIVCDEAAAEDLKAGTVKYFKDIEEMGVTS
jgi:glucosamine-6-phosphate deaminase